MHKQASEQPDTHLNLVKYIKNLNRINLSTSIAFYLYFFSELKSKPICKDIQKFVFTSEKYDYKISQIPSVYLIKVFNSVLSQLTFVSKFKEVGKNKPSVQLLGFQFK